MRLMGRVLRRVAIPVAVLPWMWVQGAHAGTLYASNFGGNTITAYDLATGAFLSTVVTAGAEASGLNGLRLSADGSLLVAAQDTNNVLRYGSNGSLLTIFDPANTAQLNSPQGLTFGADDNLYVVSAANDRILKYDPATGDFLGTFADLSGNGHIGPIDLAFGPDGNLYVTGFDNPVIVKINGTTGAILGTKQGPAGLGFGPAAFGPGGAFYVLAGC
jgi:DNA-binding beta-propeller fold protein YncE